MSLSITIIILLITCAVSLSMMNNAQGKAILIFHPVTIKQKQQWYRFLSSGFIHADVPHLAINMFVFWSFGSAVEKYYFPQVFGDLAISYFLALYFGGIIVSSIPSFIRHHNDPRYAALGASGGVASVVFAVIIFSPWENLYLFGVIGIPQIIAGVLYLVYSWCQDKRASDNVGHMAHLTGAIWGFAFTAMMEPRLFTRFINLTLAGPQ